MELMNDIRALVEKYENQHTAAETLHKITEMAALRLANLNLHKRMNEDVFDLFEKDDNGYVVGEGGRLRDLATVVSSSSSRTLEQVCAEVVVEFREPCNKLDQPMTLQPKRNGAKKKRGPSDVAAVMSVDVVRVCVRYNEVGVGPHRRGPGVSVLESPCRTVNLTISASRGAGGLDRAVVADFQLLTAGHGPATSQVLLDPSSLGDGDSSGDGESSDGPEPVDGEAGSVAASEAEDDQCDASDYFSVEVDRRALSKLCDWLSFGEREAAGAKRSRGSAAEEALCGAEARHGFYERRPRCADLLMLLLSLPAVDDAWGVHTLILDHELGDQDEPSDDEEEEQ